MGDIGRPEVEPSLDQGLASDRYLAGRVEELDHTGNVADPNLRGVQKLEYQREVRALVKKIQGKMPSLLPWIENYVIGVIHPEFAVEKIDRALEHIFNREEDATPRRAAGEVMHYKRMPQKMFAYVWRRAQVVKLRLYRRKQRAEQRAAFSAIEDV
jgi:hypothetical protein